MGRRATLAIRTVSVLLSLMLAVGFLQPRSTSAANTLGITKTVVDQNTGSTTTTSVGDTLTYRLFLTNATGTAIPTTVSDVVQPGQTYTPGSCTIAPAVQGTGATCALIGGTVQFTGLSVPANYLNASPDLTFQTTVNAGATGSIANQASVSGGGQLSFSNTTSILVAGTSLNGAGLNLEKQVSNISTGGAESAGITASPGNTVRYYLLVGANALQQSATGVVITDTLQGAQTFANHCSVACTFDGANTVRLSVGNLAPGTQTLVTFDATINSSTCGQVITNRASAAGSNSNAVTSNGTSVVVQGSCLPTPIVNPPVTCPYSCNPQPPTVCPTSCSYTPPYSSGYGTCGYFYSCNGCANAAYGCVGSAYSHTVTVCGTVQTYQAPVGATTGYMTINGEAFILMPYMVASGVPIAVGSAYCLSLTINGYCQITSMVVSPNVASANYLCGTVTPFNYGYAPWGASMPYANYAPYSGYNPFYGPGSNYGSYALNGTSSGYYGYSGPMMVGGYPYPVAQNVAFPFSVSYGNPYCFVQNNAGSITGSLSVVPTAATAVESPSGTRRAHGAGSV